MIFLKKFAFSVYLFTLSYFIFSEETICSTFEFTGMSCKWILICVKSGLIGLLFTFIDYDRIINMIFLKKFAFPVYLFTLSYFIFNETSCTSFGFTGMSCKWILYCVKSGLIGLLFTFIDRKFLFFNSSKE